MRRTLQILLVGYLLLAPGCKSASQELADRSIMLLEGALVVLETHEQNPEEAPAAFREYVDRNQNEIHELERLSQELLNEGPEENATAIKRRFLDKSKGLSPRLRAMAAIYGADPEVMTALEKIQPKFRR